MARRRSNTGIPGLSFSWKRATGLTRLQRKVSRYTGVPLSRSGRQRKYGRMASGGCCLVYALVPVLTAILVAIYFS